MKKLTPDPVQNVREELQEFHFRAHIPLPSPLSAVITHHNSLACSSLANSPPGSYPSNLPLLIVLTTIQGLKQSSRRGSFHMQLHQRHVLHSVPSAWPALHCRDLKQTWGPLHWTPSFQMLTVRISSWAAIPFRFQFSHWRICLGPPRLPC